MSSLKNLSLQTPCFSSKEDQEKQRADNVCVIYYGNLGKLVGMSIVLNHVKKIIEETEKKNAPLNHCSGKTHWHILLLVLISDGHRVHNSCSVDGLMHSYCLSVQQIWQWNEYYCNNIPRWKWKWMSEIMIGEGFTACQSNFHKSISAFLIILHFIFQRTTSRTSVYNER